MIIIAGHTRHKALKGIPEYSNGKIMIGIADDLDKEKVNKLRLLDNKVAEHSDWDLDALKIELGDLDDDFSVEFFSDMTLDTIDKDGNDLLPPSNDMCEHRYKCSKCDDEL